MELGGRQWGHLYEMGYPMNHAQTGYNIWNKSSVQGSCEWVTEDAGCFTQTYGHTWVHTVRLSLDSHNAGDGTGAMGVKYSTT